MRCARSFALCTLLPLAAALSACTQSGSAAAGAFTEMVKQGKPLFATIKTSQGDIVVELDSQAAPETVGNFVALAAGEKEWVNPAGDKTRKPLYDGTVFHRVIPRFMIQGGDPQGDGSGGPGFTINDEFDKQKGLHFAKGTLGMARKNEPHSAGCQWFITVGDAGWLDGKYTVMGHVVAGQEVADAISVVPTRAPNRPVTDVVIQKVSLSDHR
jgi:peptidyl-prolyl cis-trans isomerase A (cyclophilin A)